MNPLDNNTIIIDNGHGGIEMKCPDTRCGYKWVPRVPNPKKCPKCLRWLDRPVKTNPRHVSGQSKAA